MKVHYLLVMNTKLSGSGINPKEKYENVSWFGEKLSTNGILLFISIRVFVSKCISEAILQMFSSKIEPG